ncbi:MAG: DddA-like double-stranded DNA deaminase toxin [Pirellulales bacterium]
MKPGWAVARGGTPAGLQSTGIEFEIASALLAGPAVLRLGKAVLGKAVLKKAVTKSSTSIPKLPTYSAGGKTTGVLRTSSGDVPLLSGRAGPAGSLAKPTPGFNAVTKTHVEGHAAAIMRQQGIKEATIYINNPKICLPCQQNLANMLPSGSKLTVVLPDGTTRTFIGNAR